MQDKSSPLLAHIGLCMASAHSTGASNHNRICPYKERYVLDEVILENLRRNKTNETSRK